MTSLARFVPPVISPIGDDGNVDRKAIDRVVAHLLPHVDGIFVLGSCGEGPTLSDQQRSDVVNGYIESVAGQIPVVMGIADPGPERARSSLDIANRAKLQALVVGAPYYFTGAAPEHVENHIRRIAAGTDLPVVAYNIPQATGNAITTNTLARLASDRVIVGLKDSSADAASSESLRSVAQDGSLQFFQGAEGLLLSSLRSGADGVIPGIANIVPGLVRDLLNAHDNGDDALADRIQVQIDAVCRDVYRGGHWLSALKQSAAFLGLATPNTTDALPALTDSEQSQLKAFVLAI